MADKSMYCGAARDEIAELQRMKDKYHQQMGEIYRENMNLREQIKQLTQQLNDTEASRKYYKNHLGDKFKRFTKDKSATEGNAAFVRVTTYEPKYDTNGNITPVKQLETVETVIYHFDVKDAERNNNIGKEEDDIPLLSRLGWWLNKLLFSKKRPKDLEKKPIRSIGDLQRRMVADPSKLYHFIYTLGSSQHQLPSLEQLASLNKEQRKTLHCAFAATSHLETGMMTWNGSQSLHPYVIYNRNLFDSFAITNRVRWYFGKMGASVGSYMTESTKKIVGSKAAFRWIPKKYFPPGTVLIACMDNVITSLKAYTIDWSISVRSAYTPEQLHNIGLYEHLDNEGGARVAKLLPFRTAFKLDVDLAHPVKEDYQALDRLSVARYEEGMSTRLNMSDRLEKNWIESLVNSNGTKEASTALAKQWTEAGLRIASLAGGNVMGIAHPGTPTLKEGWEDRIPRGNQKFGLAANNNILEDGLDLIEQSVGMNKSVAHIMIQGQMECGIGPVGLNKYFTDPREGEFPNINENCGNENENENDGNDGNDGNGGNGGSGYDFYRKLRHYVWLLGGGRFGFAGDLAPAMKIEKIYDEEAETKTTTIEDGRTSNSMGGMHVTKENFMCIGRIFSDLFLRDWLRPIFKTETEQDYLLFPRDHRPRKEEEAQIQMAIGVAMTIGYERYQKNRDKNQLLFQTDALELDEYIMKLGIKRPSLFPVLLYLRCTDLCSGLRRSGTSGKRGDFDLYQNMSNISQLLYSVTNAQYYLKCTIDQRIKFATCPIFEFLLQKTFTFCALSEQGNPLFFDEQQEKWVQVSRILCPNERKKHTLKVAREWRNRFQNACPLMASRRNIKQEVEYKPKTSGENQSNDLQQNNAQQNNVLQNEINNEENVFGEGEGVVLDDHQIQETFPGELACDALDVADDTAINPDQTRPRVVRPIFVSVLRMLLKQHLFDWEGAIDSNGLAIPDHKMVSLIDCSIGSPKQPSHTILELPTIMMERNLGYVNSCFIGPKQNKRTHDEMQENTSSSSSTSSSGGNDDGSGSSSSSSSSTTTTTTTSKTNGTTFVHEWHGRWRGRVARPGTGKYFHVLPMSRKQIDSLKGFYNDRIKCDNAWKLANERMGTIPGMLFTKPILIKELTTLKARDTTGMSAKEQSALGAIPNALSGNKLSLCSVLAKVRKAGIDASDQLIRDNQFKENVVAHGKNWRRSVKYSETPTGFYPFKQRLLAIDHNTATADRNFDLGENSDSDEEVEDISELPPLEDDDELETAATLLEGMNEK